MTMKLQEIKQRTRHEWETLISWQGVVVEQPGEYEREIKKFGDRRCRTTWIVALARLVATNLNRGCLDAEDLITMHLNFKPGQWDYEIREKIFDEFLSFPDGLELIRTGLENLVEQGVAHQYKEEADGIFELLVRREKQIGASGRADKPAVCSGIPASAA
jgi:hypothetical protein